MKLTYGHSLHVRSTGKLPTQRPRRLPHTGSYNLQGSHSKCRDESIC